MPRTIDRVVPILAVVALLVLGLGGVTLVAHSSTATPSIRVPVDSVTADRGMTGVVVTLPDGAKATIFARAGTPIGDSVLVHQVEGLWRLG